MLATGPNIPPPGIWFPPGPGVYTVGFLNSAQGTNRTLGSVNRIYGTPCVLPKVGTYDAMSIRVDTPQAASTGRMGLYADDGTGSPGDLIEEAGTFTPTTADFFDVTFAAPLVVGPGLFWLALQTDDTGVAWETSTTGGAYLPGIIQAASSHFAVPVVYAPHTNGAFPATFTAGGALVLDGNTAPRLVLRGG